mmetsp:Transcript_12917/g.47239  ORF Transcript_12917/g.47239 Transcript_12917/m.47239 type:complete len:202 (-) Transcript_12917:501-1106(-)
MGPLGFAASAGGLKVGAFVTTAGDIGADRGTNALDGDALVAARAALAGGCCLAAPGAVAGLDTATGFLELLALLADDFFDVVAGLACFGLKDCVAFRGMPVSVWGMGFLVANADDGGLGRDGETFGLDPGASQGLLVGEGSALRCGRGKSLLGTLYPPCFKGMICGFAEASFNAEGPGNPDLTRPALFPIGAVGLAVLCFG